MHTTKNTETLASEVSNDVLSVHLAPLSRTALPERGTDTHGQPRMRLVVQGSPFVRTVRNLLTKTECNALIDHICTLGLSRPAFDESVRRCERRHTIDPGMSSKIMERLRPFLPEVIRLDGARWKLLRFTHHWRYVRYHAGGHFVPHYDGAKMLDNPPALTVFTVQIYLNEEFDGGCTRFYSDYEPERFASHVVQYGEVTDFARNCGEPTHIVRPETGSALVFNHVENVLHDGQTIEKGVKFILRGDIMYQIFPEDAPSLVANAQTVEDRSVFHWCQETAARRGTRTHVGEVWMCACASDSHGADCDISAPSDWDEHKLTDQDDDAKMHVVLMSGKRFAGKDFVANRLHEILEAKGLRVHRAALGGINKRANKAGIDFERLTTDRVFRERSDTDPTWCVGQVFADAHRANADVLLLTDLRTRDFESIRKRVEDDPLRCASKIVVLRIDASDEARVQRGWKCNEGSDRLFTEMEFFDSFRGWTACFDNSDNSERGDVLAREWVTDTVLPRMPLVVLA